MRTSGPANAGFKPLLRLRGPHSVLGVIRRLLIAAAVAAAAIGLAPSAGADPLSDLWPLLPLGYQEDTCQPGTPEGSQLAIIHCGGLPNGPSEAHFVMAESIKAARANFDFTFQGKSQQLPFTPVECPGSGGIRGTWAAGLVACGVNERDSPYLMYTNGPMFGVAFGNDHGTLFKWWYKAAVDW